METENALDFDVVFVVVIFKTEDYIVDVLSDLGVNEHKNSSVKKHLAVATTTHRLLPFII